VDGLDGATTDEGVNLFVTPPGSTGFRWVFASILARDPSLSARRVLLSSPGHFTNHKVGSSTTRATLRVSRTGTVVTFSSTADGDTLEETTSTFATGDLVVGLGLVGGAADRPITARVSRFTVIGGGGDVLSDEFDCPAVLH
jgi:hypothetical protein